MKYLFVILLCLTALPLSGCLVLWALTATEYRTYCEVEDSEANRLKVMEVVRLIVNQYSLQERQEKRSPHSSEWMPMASYYYYSSSGYPSSAIDLKATAYNGRVTVGLYQQTLGSTTKKYAEIQEKLVSEIKERFGEGVDVKIQAGKMY